MSNELRRVNQKSVEAYKEFGDPLKHVARYVLWLPEARGLREQKRRFLTYFTLPGKWAWDIFFFECVYLGFSKHPAFTVEQLRLCYIRFFVFFCV